MSAIVDRRELSLVLFELLGVERLQVHQRFAGYDRDAIQQVLDTAQHLAVSRFQPIAAEADANEPHFVGGRVLMPEGIGQALAAYAEAGFFALPFPEIDCGLRAPWVVHTAAAGIFSCANTAVANYAFLTIAAANLLRSAFRASISSGAKLPETAAG